MAPSTKELEDALVDGTCHIFSVDPDATSVNKVRRHVEEKLELEEGFLTSDEWKQKSKVLIKANVEKLLDGWTPGAKTELESKNGAKRQSSDVKSPEPKRQKRSTMPVKAEESELSDLSEEEKKPKGRKLANKPVKSESELSELSEEERKPKVKKGAPRRKVKKMESDDEETPVKAVASPKRNRKPSLKDESEEDKEVKSGINAKQKAKKVKTPDSSDEENKPAVKKQQDSDGDMKDVVKDEESQPAVDEEEEYSDVIDEPPQPKRKKKDKKESSKPVKASKSTTKSKSAPKSAPAPDDPDEAEIKKLQSHLAKCGIRKLWHIELKKYGDDPRAKIRHLKKMLAEIGMDGRFSEAKAREVKEMRELQADAEAAQEMNALWGMNSGGRASRSKSTTEKVEVKDESDEDEDKGGDDEEEDDKMPATFGARRRRADLAFLGDDSDSD